MARIPETEIERLKKEVSVERLVEASGVALKKVGEDLAGRCLGTMGTPVRSDYRFNMGRIDSAVALSSPNDIVQRIGGGAIKLIPGYQFGPAGRERPEPGFQNVSAAFDSAGRGHSGYYSTDLGLTTTLFGMAMNGPAANGGFLLYPNKPNDNMSRQVYAK